MLFKTYENICKKHNVKPSQVIADKNIAEILTQDQGKHLKRNEILLHQELEEISWGLGTKKQKKQVKEL